MLARTHGARNVIGLVAVGFALLLLGRADAVQLTWTGNGDNITWDDELNWDGTASTEGTIDMLNLIDEYIVGDPTFNISSGTRLNFREGGGLTMSAGTLELVSAQGLGLLETPDSFGFLNLTGGSVTAQFLAELEVTLGGDATLNLNGGGNPVNISTIDFTSETSLLHFVAETPTDFMNEHIGKVTSFGNGAVEGLTINVVSDGVTGSNITAIDAGGFPELSINRGTGEISLTNTSGTATSFLGYSITSPNGALDPASWTTVTGNYDVNGGKEVDADNAWTILTDTADPTYRDLSEAELEGGDGGSLADQQTVNLGNAWIQSPRESVGAELLLPGGFRYPMNVSFTGNGDEPFGIGDLDFNGTVDELDWDIFRDGLFADLSTLTPAQAYGRGDLDFDGVNDEKDFNLFKAAYNLDNGGAGAFSAMIAGVPEPSSLLLLVLGATALIGSSRPRRDASRTN